MKLKKTNVSPKVLAHLIADGMQEKKGIDVVLLDLKTIKNSIADYFVICSGSSDTQIDAIKDSIDEFVYRSAGENPWRVEGSENKEWIILDYVSVVAHVFKKDKRVFYGLEDLWGDAEAIYLSEANSGNQ